MTREEIDALRVTGVDPVHRLVMPRVLAATLVTLVLTSIVSVLGIVTGFAMSVLVQDASPGQFVASLGLLVKMTDFVVGNVEAVRDARCAGRWSTCPGP